MQADPFQASRETARPGPPIKCLIGQRFGQLLVLRRAGRTKGRQTRWLCQCDCGKETVVVRGNLTTGHTQSCGCLHATAGGEGRGAGTTPEYVAWRAAINRCENKKDKKYPDYGGRGIRVWSGWRGDYMAFLGHVGRRPSADHSLDRIDNSKGYEPGNVRWATKIEQASNRRGRQKLNWRESSKHAYAIIRDFEYIIASYTGAPYAVACDSCTSAVLLSCAYLRVAEVEIPKLTYISIPQAIVHAGGSVKFRDEDWQGMYQLKPYPIFDSARLMTSGMYQDGTFMCLSFHWTKHLPAGRGGAILLDDGDAADWLRRARFDGRDLTKQGKAAYEPTTERAWRVNMSPTVAAQGMMVMAAMKEHNEPLPRSDYPDLSLAPVFTGKTPA